MPDDQTNQNVNDPVDRTTSPVSNTPGFDQPQPVESRPLADPVAGPAPSDPLITTTETTTTESVVPAETSPTADNTSINGTPVDPTVTVTQTTTTTEATGPQSAFGVAPVKKKKRIGLIVGLILTVLVVLLAAGTVAGYFLVYQKPENVVADAVSKAVTAGSVSAKVNLVVKNKDYTITVDADGNSSVGKNGQTNVTLKYESTETTYTVKGSALYASNGDLYIKLQDVRKLVETVFGAGFDASTFNSLITKIDGQWIKISTDDLAKYDETYKDSQKCLADVSAKLSKDKAVSNEITNVYKQNAFVVIDKELAAKSVNGVDSIGYNLSYNTAKLKAFVAALSDTQLGKDLKNCDSKTDFKAASDDIDGNYKGTTELFVSRFTHEITEFSYANNEDGSDGKIVVNPVFNKNFDVQVPTSSVSLQDLQTEIEKIYADAYAY